MGDTILQIQEKFHVDESIKGYEYVEYQPQIGCPLNGGSGQITITIENTDDFFHPRHSWLLIEGNLVKKADDGVYEATDLISLTNNGIMYLFADIKYSLGGQEIENLNHPGFATTMLGMAKYPLDYAKGPGIMQCWYPDTTTAAAATNIGFTARRNYIIAKPVPVGSFSFAIPCEHIFGFCEDYDKVMYGMRHSLTLVRTGDDDAIFKAAAVADLGRVKLSKISWMMPRVQPNDEMKYKLYKSIESKVVLDVAFRMRQCNITEISAQATSMEWRLGVRTAPEKPRYLIIGIQTDKSGSQNKNPALFDHNNVTNMCVRLNSVKYQPLDVNANFTTHQYIQFYKYMAEFSRDYYGMDPLVGCTAIQPIAYKELTPLFIFNVSKQSERLNQGVVDVTVGMEFAANPAANTRAYALVISDRRLKLQSDGRKMSVMY